MVPVAASSRDALQAAQGQGRRARSAKPTKGQSDLKETRFLQKCPEIDHERELFWELFLYSPVYPVLLPLLKYSVCLILLCHSNPVWIPVSPLELLSHPSTRCEDNRYKVHTTLLA